MSLESDVYEAVKLNSLVFLNKGIKELSSHNDSDDTPLDIDLTTISISLLQISFELALNAYSIKKTGIRSILRNKESDMSDNEISTLFQSNELPTKNFNILLDEMQLRYNLFDTEALHHIRLFQKIRNKLVHLHCNLDEGDRYDLKYELIYFIVHILIWLINTTDIFLSTSQILENQLDDIAYKKLILFQPYVDEMEKLARRDSNNVYRCFFCRENTFATEMELCYTCNYDFADQVFTDCGRCKATDSVIYDHLNIEINDNEARGLCLNCDDDDIYYRCPECENLYGLEASIGVDICTPVKCQQYT
jgi:uncharacterized protein YehS (DUF1456 family)